MSVVTALSGSVHCSKTKVCGWFTVDPSFPLVALYFPVSPTWQPSLFSSLRKHPFLLALRRWGRFARRKRPQRRRARRNGCFRRLVCFHMHRVLKRKRNELTKDWWSSRLTMNSLGIYQCNSYLTKKEKYTPIEYDIYPYTRCWASSHFHMSSP